MPRNPVEITEFDKIDSTTAIVTWCWLDGVPTTVEVELEWQPADPDVGINAGFNVYGDAPDEVLNTIAERATDYRDEDYYDYD